MDILLVHGKEKIPVSLNVSNSAIEADTLTVQHLAEEVEKVTKIAPGAQRLIHRGKTLFKTFDLESPALKTTLQSLNITNGARVMVLGKPTVTDTSTKEEKGVADLMKVLDDHQSRINDICMLCATTVDKIKKEPGNIDDWKGNEKFFLVQSEYSMKELTLLDATPGGISDAYRAKRKALVNQLLSNVSLCDQQIENLRRSIKDWEKRHGGHTKKTG